ncbi:MAG: flagellar M-ring protein FliF [Gemmatimonadales bacterium]|nr:flagellar M-ring protein FliF [Gemmatimonadales bacterium]
MPPGLLSIFDRVGGIRRAIILLVGLSAAVGVFGLARWASAPGWVPAFGDVPISDVGAITDRLTQAGVKYKLGGNGGTLLVQTTDVAKARVALARAGVLPSGDRPGFELFDQPSWGQTDLTQRVNYRRALEGELERTIGSMRGIKRAKVHLVIREAESYGVAPLPAEASVMLEPRGEDPISADVVRGIARTVAASVEGLTSDHVTIVDDAGRPLSEGEEPMSSSGMSSRQLAMQLEIENSLREKAERLLVPVVGNGNARVQVNATLNFDRIERSSQRVDPERQSVSTEQKAEVIAGTDGGASTSNTAASYLNSTQTESVAEAVGNLKRLSVAVLLAAPAPAAADAAGAAPAIANDTAGLRSQVESLVRSAVGYDPARGDVVTVAMLPFIPAPTLPAVSPLSTLETLQSVQRPALNALGILLAFIIALLALRAAGKTSETVTALAGAPGYLPTDAGAAGRYQAPFGAQAHMSDGGQHGGAPGRPLPMISIPSNPVRDQVLATVQQQPDAAAKLMRAWLRDG